MIMFSSIVILFSPKFQSSTYVAVALIVYINYFNDNRLQQIYLSKSIYICAYLNGAPIYGNYIFPSVFIIRNISILMGNYKYFIVISKHRKSLKTELKKIYISVIADFGFTILKFSILIMSKLISKNI